MFLLREIDANKNSLLPVDILTMILNSPLIIFCRLFLGEKKKGNWEVWPLKYHDDMDKNDPKKNEFNTTRMSMEVTN